METVLDVIDCDAPPFAFVQLCGKIGMERPEDVRWCPLQKHVDSFKPKGWFAWLTRLWVKKVKPVCGCKRKMPLLYLYRLRMIDYELVYMLGQCKLCKRIYWHQVT